ncbi:hypothetical protein [Flindersiella endophytica]
MTSRNALAGLAAVDDAHVLTLDALEPDEAVALLTRVVGAGRVRREVAAAGDLAELGARLPLALRIVSAHLATRPELELGELAERLRAGNRLEALAIPDDPRATLSVTFDLSYRALGEPARRLYRLLGVVPGADCTRETAAAARDVDVADAEPLLAELAAAHLAEEHVPDRFQVHDLLREDALDRCCREDDEPSSVAAVARVLEGWLAAAGQATLVLDVGATRRVTTVRTQHGQQPGAGISSPAEAAAWVDAEHGNLLAAVRQAAADEARGPVARLSVWLTAALYRPLHFRGYWQGPARPAAAVRAYRGPHRRRCGSGAGAGGRRLHLVAGGRHRPGHRVGPAGVDDLAYERQGDAAAARRCWRQALDILEAIDDPRAAEVRARLVEPEGWASGVA